MPGITTQVATFQIVNQLGLFNTRWSAIALFIGTDIVSIYIFMQFMRGDPAGARRGGTAGRRLALHGSTGGSSCRCSKPAIATVVIIKGVAIYNEFYIPFLYMPSPDLGVMSTSLFRFKGPYRHAVGGDLGRRRDHDHPDADPVPRPATLGLPGVHPRRRQVTAPARPPRSGFNVQWAFVSPGPPLPPPDLRLLDFLAGHGFDFVRLPMDYRAWTVGTAYRAPTPDVLASLDAYLAACRARGIHLSVNVHRAPGYCITGQELEVHDLWHDAVAQAGFVQADLGGVAAHFLGIPADADGGGELISRTLLHHSNELYYRERVPLRQGLVRLDAGPSVLVRLHGDCPAAPARVRVRAHLDKSGQAALVALPPQDTANMMDDRCCAR